MSTEETRRLPNSSGVRMPMGTEKMRRIYPPEYISIISL